MNFLKNILGNSFRYSPDKGDNTTERTGKPMTKLDVQVLDKQPVEKTLGSAEYMQQPVAVENVFSETGLSKQGEDALKELKLSLEIRSLTADEKQAYIDKFTSEIKGETDEKSIINPKLESIIEASMKGPLEEKSKEEDAVIKKISALTSDVVQEAPPIAVEIEKPKGYVLKNSEFNKQKEAFKEALRGVPQTVIFDEYKTKEIVYRFGEALESMRKDKVEIIAKSSERIDLWNAMIDAVLQKIKLERDWKIQTDALLNSVIGSIGSPLPVSSPKEEIVEENKVENAESSKKLSEVIVQEEPAIPEIFVEPVNVNVSVKEKRKNSRGENSLERVVGLIERTKNAKIEKIKAGEKAVGRIKIEEISKENLSDDENEKVINQIDETNKEIEKVREEESLLEYRLERMKTALEIWKTKIGELNPKNNEELKPLGFYVKKVTDVKRDGIIGEYLERLNDEIKKTETEIKEVWKAKKLEFEKYTANEKRKEPLAKKTQQVKEQEPESEKPMNDVWADELKKALGKIKIMTMEEVTEKYDPSQIVEAFDADYAKKLAEFLHSHEHDSVDQFTKREKELFEGALKSARIINDENNSLEIVIVNGKTYKMRKAVEPASLKPKKQQKKDIIKKDVVVEGIVKTEDKKDDIIKSGEARLPHVWDSLREHPENFELVLNELQIIYWEIVGLMDLDDRLKGIGEKERTEILRDNMNSAVNWVIKKHFLTDNEQEKIELRNKLFDKIHEPKNN